MPNKIDYAHMKAAEGYAELSYAKRLKVGAIITKDDRVISIGYNGTPAGWDNDCEYEDIGFSDAVFGELQTLINRGLKTKPEVLHAEANAIGKLARSSESGINATMYLTHSPCFDCAKLIHVAGINKVFYRTQYRNTDGIEFLNKCNIEVEKI
jgi:dCMP deaminase